MRTLFASTALVLLTVSGGAMAQTMATAAADVDIRTGPGAQYPITASVGVGSPVSLIGCVEASDWCEVHVGNQAGWTYADGLAIKPGAAVAAIVPQRAPVGVTVVEQTAPVDPVAVQENAAVGGLGGAAMGALIAGPVGLVAGAILGGTVGTAAAYEPSIETTTYVTTNVVEPVYLEGDVVVGAGVPETVTIYTVPTQPEYRYAQINGRTVLVNAADRRIVYVYP